MKETETERLVVVIDKQLKDEFKQRIRQEGLSMKSVIESFCQRVIDGDLTDPGKSGQQAKELSFLQSAILKEVQELFSGEDLGNLKSLLSDTVWDPAYASYPNILSAKVEAAGGDPGLVNKVWELSPCQCFFLQRYIIQS